MEDRFVLDSPALEAAVTYRNSTGYPPRRPGKNSLEDPPAMGGGYDGMFAVSIIDGMVHVAPGYTDLGEFEGGYLKEDDPAIGYVCLVADVSLGYGEERFSVRCSQNPHRDLYKAGDYVYWELARKINSADIIQLHIGGMIAFRERYYIS